MKTLTAAAAALVLAGCAAKGPPLPMAQTLCLQVMQESPMEVAYVKRKATEFAREHGFRIVDEQCDVRIKYDRFGGFQGESLVVHPFWISRNGYWSQEGIVHVEHGGKMVLEDYPVNLRGYSTKQSLLDDLAWQAVRPATWLFQPGTPVGGTSASPPASAAGATTTTGQVGSSSHEIERMDEVKACNPTPRATLVGKGAGFEAYTVSCRTGDMLQVRCEFGACRVLR